MVQCAHVARRYDDRFNRTYQQVARKGIKGKAVVAVAHKMLRIVYFMLRDNTPYRGQNVEMTTRKLKSLEVRGSIGLRI
jgi:hypothetical protein